MEHLIILFFLITGCIISAWSGYELGKTVNKANEITEPQILPNTVRLYNVGWEFVNDMVVYRVHVYGYIYINDDKIRLIIKTFSDEDMDYNIRCAEELIDKITERT